MAEWFAGSWARVSLASLLQLLEQEDATGWLELGTVGRVGLRQGNVVRGEAPPVQGRAALRTLFLTPPSGTFQFHAGDVEGACLGRTVALIMDGIRIGDEWERLLPLVLNRSEPSTGEPIAALLLDGTRPVLDVVLEAGALPALVVEPLTEGIADRTLTVTGRDPEARERWIRHGMANIAPDPMEGLDSFECLLLGRDALRAGDLDRAEEAFRRATELAPTDRIANQNLRRVCSMRGTEGAQ